MNQLLAIRISSNFEAKKIYECYVNNVIFLDSNAYAQNNLKTNRIYLCFDGDNSIFKIGIYGVIEYKP